MVELLEWIAGEGSNVDGGKSDGKSDGESYRYCHVSDVVVVVVLQSW